MSKIIKIFRLLKALTNPKKLSYLYEQQEPLERKRALLHKDFLKDFEVYNKNADISKLAKTEFLYPCLYDKTETTELEPTYFYQDAWALESIIANKPFKHIDIGSHHKFVAHLSKIVDLTMVDIRPLSLPMESIKFIEGSILELPFERNSIESLSSICVVEHIGLGRYGDPIDPDGSEKAFKEIDRVLKIDGNFYFSVPVEIQNKIYFNAHRAFSESYLFEKLLTNYKIIDKKYIYGNEYTNEFKNQFGTGCYHLRKIK